MNPTRGQIADATAVLGWRLILGVLEAHVLTDSLDASVQAAASAVAAAGADGAGHLTIELFDDRAVLRLQNSAGGHVTDLDLRLAERISAALPTVPGDAAAVPQTFEIAIDALDIAAVRPFWRAVTGYVDAPHPPEALVDPLGRGPTIWFQQMDEPRHDRRNRIHIDVDVPPEHAGARIGAVLAVGGRLVSADAAPAFWVLADAEGNEACVCTWQGRD